MLLGMKPCRLELLLLTCILLSRGDKINMMIAAACITHLLVPRQPLF